MRSEILAPVRPREPWYYLQERQDFTVGSYLKLTSPHWAHSGFLQSVFNCHMTGSRGMQKNTWEKLPIQIDWYVKQGLCPVMVALQSESPILVWELGGSLPEETCFVLQGEVTPAAISSSLEMAGTAMSSLWNGCPALLPPVLQLLSEKERVCPTPGTPHGGCSCL